MGIIILILTVICVALFVLVLYNLQKIKEIEIALDYYRSRLMKMVANDSLVEESFEIICEAYNVEEGDLRNYISKYQKRKETT